MEEEKKYLYSVRPRRTIKSLPEVGPIRTAKSLYLSKEEVLLCLKDATVYRRFAADNNVQVAGRDLDRLHNEVFYSEKEWEKIKADSLGKDRGTTEEVKSAKDSQEAKADEKSVATVVEQEPTASAPGQDASNTGTDVQEAEPINNNNEEIVIQTQNPASGIEPTKADSAVTVNQNNNDETERENDATFAQSSDEDQTSDVSDDTQANFQPSHIQMNVSGKKKNKR